MGESKLKIKKITITGMHKVSQKSYELNDDITYFVGPNGAGKSTILEAIQLALLGYIPGYAKTNESIMKHASGPVLAIVMELDSGIVITRTWTKTGASVSSKVDIQGYSGKAAQLTEELVGQIELPIFNFNEFRTMTANKLKEWFISFLPDSEGSINLIQELEDEASKRAVPHDELLENAVAWIESRPEKGVDLIKALNAHFKEDQSYVKGQVSKLQGTIESLVRYDDADDLDEAEIRASLVSNETLEAKLIAYEAQENMQVQIKQQIQALRNTVSADTSAEDPEVIELQAKVEDLTKHIDSLKKELASKPADISMDSEILDLQKKIEIMREDYSDIQQAILELTRKKAALPTAEPICPYTKEKCDTAIKLADTLKAEAEEIDKQIQFKEEESNDCSPEEIGKLQSQIATRELKLRTAKSVIEAQISKAEIEINQINLQLAQINSNYSMLESMQAQLIDIGERPTELSQLELTSKIATYREQLSKLAANKQYAELTETVTKDKFKLEGELEVLKDWIKLTDANGLQSKLMDKPFENLATDMSKYLSAMFNTPTEAKFNLVSKANSFSFGIERNGSYIEFDYLSSGERCLFTLALIMCILDKSHSEMRTIVIDDILDHLDADNATYLFDALKNVKDTQFILAGVKECQNTAICKAV